MAQGLIRPGSGPNRLLTLPSPTHARCSIAGRRVNHVAEHALHCCRASHLCATRLCRSLSHLVKPGALHARSTLSLTRPFSLCPSVTLRAAASTIGAAAITAACCSGRAATSHLGLSWIDQRVRLGPWYLPATPPPPSTTIAAEAVCRPTFLLCRRRGRS